MTLPVAFSPLTPAPCIRKAFIGATLPATSSVPRPYLSSRCSPVPRRINFYPRADATERSPEELAREEQLKSLHRMRSRLEGLFGAQQAEVEDTAAAEFDGCALRNAIMERWGVQYDVQPQKRHGRVYVQVRV